ncbi:phosphodiesterase [Plastorhodobacter daqingensis]|uniref:Phosphodiesterase n=1 Tax=Plastorhodobacter daqingensis TaxID=1387281 RepID=A0ABW2UIR7_9RHOB
MKIIQITDTHLLPPGGRLHGLDPADQLRRAIDHICQTEADADLLVITGDLCNDGDPEAYALLREILAPVPFPVRMLLGNHDARPAFREAFPDHPIDAAGYVQSTLDSPHGRLLFLDSHEPGLIGGRYGADRLGWLRTSLERAGPQPVTVFIHHPPVPDGLAHFASIGLHDAAPLMQVLAAHPGGVRHIVFGHIHVPLAGTSREGIAFSSGQAMSHRFITAPADPAPWWAGGNPCYRLIQIDTLGFRAYGVEVGQQPIARAAVCAGP